MIPLHAGNPGAMTGAGNWTYFLPGRSPVLIDAGVGEAAHVIAIEDVASEGPGHVLVTHAHSDHIAGVTAIASRWPGTEFSKLPWPERDQRFPAPWRALADGQVVAAGDASLEVIHTPGHAPDHVCFWNARERALFSGDLVVSGTTVVIPASMGGSLSHYLRSLERVLALRPRRLYPAHGPPIDAPEAIIHRYIAHRQEREKQVIAGLRQGLRSIDQLVGHIYIGLDPALVPMAQESVLAHLRKLLDEGVVTEEGGAWALY
jgi:glyoxylase-like metal-dependent hydrolase (beta-lactamase superfamily II)